LLHLQRLYHYRPIGVSAASCRDFIVDGSHKSRAKESLNIPKSKCGKWSISNPPCFSDDWRLSRKFAAKKSLKITGKSIDNACDSGAVPWFQKRREQQQTTPEEVAA
jgi:hypothetical protein